MCNIALRYTRTHVLVCRQQNFQRAYWDSNPEHIDEHPYEKFLQVVFQITRFMHTYVRGMMHHQLY